MNWSDYAKDIETYQREVRDLRCEADVLNALWDWAQRRYDEYGQREGQVLMHTFVRRYGSKP